MGRERRHGRSCRRHRLGLRLCDLRRSEDAGSRHPVEDAVAGAARGFDGAIGPPRLRRLRQRHQQCRFAEGEPPGLLAEIGERGRTNAFDVAAIGRHAEIKREHLVLGEAALDLDGADDLAQLCRQRTLAARLQQPRHLHREGRTAGHDVAMGEDLRGRPQQGDGVDAGMLAESLVLIRDQQGEIAGIDAVRPHRQPPATLCRRVGPQQPAVAVHHRGREREPLAERRGSERPDPYRGNARGDQCRARAERCGNPRRPHPSAARAISHRPGSRSGIRGRGTT